MTIDKELINRLLEQAKNNPRLRQNYDLRTSPDDTSQRMLNAMMPETKVAIHHHPNSAENMLCICGRLDVILYKEDNTCPPLGFENGMDAMDVVRDKRLKEISRYHLDPSEGNYGCVVPKGTWHTVEVLDPCVIYQANGGKYGEDGSENW